MAYFPQFGMQQQMGMAPMQRQMQPAFQGLQRLQGLQGLGQYGPQGLGQGIGGQGFQGLMGLQERLAALQNQQLGASQQLNPGFSNVRTTDMGLEETLRRQRGDLQGLGGPGDWAQRIGDLGQQTQPPPLTAETNRMYSGAQQMEQWRNRQRAEEMQRATPQQLLQGLGGREDTALPGTGQTQPAPNMRYAGGSPDFDEKTGRYRPGTDPRQPAPNMQYHPEDPRIMGAGFPGGPPIRSPGAAEQEAGRNAAQIAEAEAFKQRGMPGAATQIGAPPLTPTKIPPGTGGVKPAPPPAPTPPPPGQIGAQPQAPTGQIPLTGPTELGAPASDPAWAPGGRWGSPPGQPTPPQEPRLGGGAPEGFIPPPPGSMNTMAMVPYYNPETGETYTASSGGGTPPPGWRQGSPDDERRSDLGGIQDRLRDLLRGNPGGQTPQPGYGYDGYGFDPGGPTIPGPDYDFLMGRDTPVSDFGGGRWGSIHDVPRSPWGRGPSRRQPFPPMMPRFGGGMPRGMGMPYGGGGPYGNLWGGGGGGFGGYGMPQMPRFGGGFGGIGGFPGMGGGYGGGFGGGFGMPQMPRFGGGFGGGMPGFGGGMGGGYGGGFGGGFGGMSPFERYRQDFNDRMSRGNSMERIMRDGTRVY